MRITLTALLCAAGLAAQIALGGYALFPNIFLLLAFFLAIPGGTAGLAAIVAGGAVMDVLSWGSVGPHVFSLAAVWLTAGRLSRTFDLSLKMPLCVSLLIASAVSYAALTVSGRLLLEAGAFTAPLQTIAAQALSNTAAGTAAVAVIGAKAIERP